MPLGVSPAKGVRRKETRRKGMSPVGIKPAGC
jgi:hypothetical protein